MSAGCPAYVPGGRILGRTPGCGARLCGIGVPLATPIPHGCVPGLSAGVTPRPWPSGYVRSLVDTDGMAKHLVDIDEETLDAARAERGTTTIKGTVNEALREQRTGGRVTSRRRWTRWPALS